MITLNCFIGTRYVISAILFTLQTMPMYGLSRVPQRGESDLNKIGRKLRQSKTMGDAELQMVIVKTKKSTSLEQFQAFLILGDAVKFGLYDSSAWTKNLKSEVIRSQGPQSALLLEAYRIQLNLPRPVNAALEDFWSQVRELHEASNTLSELDRQLVVRSINGGPIAATYASYVFVSKSKLKRSDYVWVSSRCRHEVLNSTNSWQGYWRFVSQVISEKNDLLSVK